MAELYVFTCEVVDENKKNYDAGHWAQEINEALNVNVGLKGLPQNGFVSVAKTEKGVEVEVAFWLSDQYDPNTGQLVGTPCDLVKNLQFDYIQQKLEELGLKVVKREIRTV